MADQTKNPSTGTAVASGKRQWPADKPLPAVLSSRDRVQALATQQTGLSGKDVRPLRNKPLQLERDLWEFIVLYVQEFGNVLEHKGKTPTLDLLLAPPKGCLVRVSRKEKGEWKPKDVIASDELKDRMGALYLHLQTNAELGKDGFHWVHITLLNGKENRLSTLAVEFAKNLHKYTSGAKAIPVKEWWSAESEANIQLVQPQVSAPAAKK